jgi:hypothetical protein
MGKKKIVVVGTPERKGQLGRRRRRQDNMKTVLKEIGERDMDLE